MRIGGVRSNNVATVMLITAFWFPIYNDMLHTMNKYIAWTIMFLLAVVTIALLSMRDVVHVTKLKPDAKLPKKRTEDAGYDIYAYFDEDYVEIKPHETKIFNTGIASECGHQYYFQALERGSTGTKGIAQRCGVIDSGYRGEWMIPITNTTKYPIIIAKEGKEPKETKRGTVIYPYEKAICQVAILPVPEMKIKEVTKEEYAKFASERGSGRLGSTGK